MKKSFGRVRRNESEEIRLTLQEADGQLNVELRVYSRSKRQGEGYVPEPEAVVVPAHALSDLCRALEEAHDSLRNEGLVESPSLPNLITMDVGTSMTMELADGLNHLAATVSDRRVAVNLPFDCYFLGAPETVTSESLPGHMAGEVRTLSRRDALVWLPEKFPVPSHLAIVIRIEDLSFRGQAEVIEAASDPRDGKYWHRLQWHSLAPHAEEALSKIIDTADVQA